jgi:hypothetical protein
MHACCCCCSNACSLLLQTTLVRCILNERHGFRIAVILNEYGGETGLESAFVQDEQVGGTPAAWLPPQWGLPAATCVGAASSSVGGQVHHK